MRAKPHLIIVDEAANDGHPVRRIDVKPLDVNHETPAETVERERREYQRRLELGVWDD